MSSQEYIRSITEIVPDNIEPTANASTSSFFSNITWQTWVIIILILALLGINIFAYLARGTQETASLFQRIIGPLLGIFGVTTKQAVETSATGAKAGIDIVADTTTSVIDKAIPIGQQNDPLDKALQNASQTPEQNKEQEVMPSDSVMQSRGKAGWCYIGEERGIRTCAEVGVNDTCMSGDVFPSQQICMNPNLRP